jgi:hypothetical protein
MYITQASNGIFKVVKNLGVIEPNESVVRHACPAVDCSGQQHVGRLRTLNTNAPGSIQKMIG